MTAKGMLATAAVIWLGLAFVTRDTACAIAASLFAFMAYHIPEGV